MTLTSGRVSQGERDSAAAATDFAHCTQHTTGLEHRLLSNLTLSSLFGSESTLSSSEKHIVQKRLCSQFEHMVFCLFYFFYIPINLTVLKCRDRYSKTIVGGFFVFLFFHMEEGALSKQL